MRLIDADALIEDLEYDVELDARQLDDMDFVGIEREHVQFDKDCKQNCIDLLQHTPAIEERKKGKWIEVYGYCTPGGDPVWACSECGKGEHVYGIEYPTYSHNVSDGQWVSCPNCGADMRGES